LQITTTHKLETVSHARVISDEHRRPQHRTCQFASYTVSDLVIAIHACEPKWNLNRLAYAAAFTIQPDWTGCWKRRIGNRRTE